MTAVTSRARSASPRRLTWTFKFVGAQTLGYLSNHIVNRVPSYFLRRAWYDHVIGIRIGRGSSVQLGVRVWFHGPGQNRRGGTHRRRRRTALPGSRSTAAHGSGWGPGSIATAPSTPAGVSGSVTT